MSAPIKRHDSVNTDGTCGICVEDADYGAYVLHSDHLASHAFDEEVERVLFEAELVKHQYCVRRDGLGDYINEPTARKWQGWLACAKARAKAAGWAE